MKKFNFTKTNSAYKYACFHVGRTDMWGWYCPETGECYLARRHFVPGVGECTGVIASIGEMPDGSWEENAERGYDCEAVRELLQLGHLTAKTLAAFLEAGGEVWWEQPRQTARQGVQVHMA